MDTCTLGYKTGRFVTRIFLAASGVTLANSSFRTISKVASLHKICSNNPEKVTQNIFECLKYID